MPKCFSDDTIYRTVHLTPGFASFMKPGTARSKQRNNCTQNNNRRSLNLMATETIVKCDLTGKIIADGNKFDPETEIPLAAHNGGLIVKIVTPESFDCDRNALFQAIGALAPQRTRTRKPKEATTAPTTEPPTGDPAPASGRRGKASEQSGDSDNK